MKKEKDKKSTEPSRCKYEVYHYCHDRNCPMCPDKKREKNEKR